MLRGQIMSLKNDISIDLTFQRNSSHLFLNYNDDKIGIFLNFKGNLRISWSFDIKHNKNIDLIFFPENNPYINYAVLYAKDFSKNIDDESSIPRELGDMRIPYNINYDFAKEILSKAGFNESQQKRFFDAHFGSVLVPIEVEFEWYAISLSEFNKAPFNFSVITFPKYDKYLTALNWIDGLECILCLGIIKTHKILPQNTTLNFPKSIASWEANEYNQKTQFYETIMKHLPYTIVFKPLPTSALVITKTNINDFIVNVRDKPDAKNGKIVAQLLSQDTNTPNIYITDSDGYTTDGSIKPMYKPMINKGREWYERDDLGSSDEIGYILYYNRKMAQSYYESNKQKLINPLFRDNYLVLIWDILPNDWCKVWILKMIDKNTISNEDNETKFSEVEFDIFRFREQLLPFIDGYAKTFNKTPSTLKLYEGYIHSSGLEYLSPFGENYIKR